MYPYGRHGGKASYGGRGGKADYSRSSHGGHGGRKGGHGGREGGHDVVMVWSWWS